jgi:exodeoxyribonuclease V beta subunit
VPDVSRRPNNHKFPDAYLYHEGGEEAIGYFAENAVAKKLSNSEENEENARLLYVALTRAKYRLYVSYCPNIKKKDGTPDMRYFGICREIFENFCNTNTCSDIQIAKLGDVLGETHEFNKEKDAESIQNPPKIFNKRITSSWQKTSFTRIAQNLEHRDGAYAPQKTDPKIPAGKRMGTLLHSIFEDLDFDAKDEEIKDIVETKLGGFDEFSNGEEGDARKKWVEKQVKIILNKELESGAGKLSGIKAGNRITELNFFMNTDKINLFKIKEIMQNKIYDIEDKELFAQYVNGAIDLVFLGKDNKYYILDWKSNSLSGYSKKEMEEAMMSHAYHLQYHIYAVALKRWLEQTKQDFDFTRDFGGVYYIFIRGVSDEEKNNDGIYFAASSCLVDNIAALDKSFNGDKA